MKIVNRVLFYSKLIFLLIAFSLVLYIGLVKIDATKDSMLAIIPMVLPYFLLLILFVTSFFFNVENNTLCNLSSLLSFVAIIIISLRTIFDKNIISSTMISFDFYIMQELRIKILLYLLLIGNIILIYTNKKNKIHS